MKEFHQVEQNRYNFRQMRILSIILLFISGAYIFQNTFFPNSHFDVLSIQIYNRLFLVIMILSTLFLIFSIIVKKEISQKVQKYILLLFMVSIVLLMLGLNFIVLHFDHGLSAYIITLMYLSTILWLSFGTYAFLSGVALFLLMLSYLIINETRAIEFYQILQGIIFYSMSWVLYRNLDAVRTENFLFQITLEDQYKMLVTESATDPLTGLYNRRYMKEEMEKELSRSKRHETPFCVVIIDIDHFKRINDQYGHIMGDEVLKEMSVILRNSIRLSDKVFRFGGEEFVFLLPETKGEDALILSERIREKVGAFSFTGIRKKITISMGISQSHKDLSIEILLQRADKRLYSAKEAGRNRVVWKSIINDRSGS